MKDQKLIYAMKDIDDGLICEAMKRRSTDVKQEGEEAETVYVSAKRKGQFWRYPVTAAAALAIAVGVLFVISNNGGIPDNLSTATGEETIETVSETDSGEVSEADETDTSAEETQPVISEAVEPIVPLKVVHTVGSSYDFPTGIYVDSYPEIPQPDFGQEYFTKMSTKELLEYYGFFNNFEYYLDDNQMIEIIDENTPHGIYTLPDGSVYDINTFTFELTKKTEYSAHKFTVTAGKKTKFGQEYCEYYKKMIEEGYKRFFYAPLGTSFYNEEKDTLFTVFNYYGVAVMFSATPEEITSDFFADDPETRAWYEKSDEKGVLPHYFDMLINIRVICLVDNEVNHYFDCDVGLWYNKEDNTYLNEETYEWIPADQWKFD